MHNKIDAEDGSYVKINNNIVFLEFISDLQFSLFFFKSKIIDADVNNNSDNNIAY